VNVSESKSPKGTGAGSIPRYEGKAKVVTVTGPDEVEVYFKDDATAFNGLKKTTFDDKGFFNARISARFFKYLEKNGIRTHYLGDIDDRTHKARLVKIVPIEVVVRNIAAGSLVKRIGMPEAKPLDPPLCEFYLKDDALGDPLLLPEHAILLGIADQKLLDALRAEALRVNGLLISICSTMKLKLVDFKLEFGQANGVLYLADEISPDTCRFWDSETNQKLDKDRFRLDLGDVMGAYREVLRRVEAALP
jgi:phosphoribosylaminoimidazole-succinocarboxamide synthase